MHRNIFLVLLLAIGLAKGKNYVVEYGESYDEEEYYEDDDLMELEPRPNCFPQCPAYKLGSGSECLDRSPNFRFWFGDFEDKLCALASNRRFCRTVPICKVQLGKMIIDQGLCPKPREDGHCKYECRPHKDFCRTPEEIYNTCMSSAAKRCRRARTPGCGRPIWGCVAPYMERCRLPATFEGKVACLDESKKCYSAARKCKCTKRLYTCAVTQREKFCQKKTGWDKVSCSFEFTYQCFKRFVQETKSKDEELCLARAKKGCVKRAKRALWTKSHICTAPEQVLGPYSPKEPSIHVYVWTAVRTTKPTTTAEPTLTTQTTTPTPTPTTAEPTTPPPTPTTAAPTTPPPTPTTAAPTTPPPTPTTAAPTTPAPPAPTTAGNVPQPPPPPPTPGK